MATISGRCGGFCERSDAVDGWSAASEERGLFISKAATGSGVVAFLAGQWKTG